MPPRAITNARQAISGHIAVLRETGQPVPQEADEDDSVQLLTVDTEA